MLIGVTKFLSGRSGTFGRCLAWRVLQKWHTALRRGTSRHHSAGYFQQYAVSFSGKKDTTEK